MEEQIVKAIIVESVMGVLGFDENNRLVEKVLFPKDAKKIAERLGRLKTGKIIDETITLIKKLQRKGYNEFMFENAEAARGVRELLKVEANVVSPSKASVLLRKNLEKFAVETKFVKKAEEIHLWLHKVSMELTKIQVKRAVEKRDLLVVQAIQTTDDMDKTINLFMSRIREWYGLHFPELNRLIDKHETYARLVFKLGLRENFTTENLEKEGLPKAKSEMIAKAAETSMGAELNEDDLEQILSLCKITLELYEIRNKLESYADLLMREVAPNIQALVGSLLGARLIALAGGLRNMAKMPASTIQVLGAEKALFRALKTGTRPPKHGIIFQHALLREARKWQRGKVARALAGKVAIATRIDAFSGKYVGDELKVDLEKRISEIQEKYFEPPLKKKVSAKEFRKRKRRKHGRRS